MIFGGHILFSAENSRLTASAEQAAIFTIRLLHFQREIPMRIQAKYMQ